LEAGKQFSLDTETGLEYADNKKPVKHFWVIFVHPIKKICGETGDEWLRNRELDISATYPIHLNAKRLSKKLIVDTSFIDGYP
jgi:hypothetical protein